MISASSESPRALPALLLGALAIGLSPIFVRLVDVGYTASAFWRLALAIPVLLLFLRPGNPVPARTLRLWIGAGLFFAADLAAWHQSIRFTSVANATLLANLAPVFVTFGAFLIFGERVRRAFVGGLLLALIGSAVLMANSSALGAGSLLGDGLGVITAIFYAGYILSVSRASKSGGLVALMLWTCGIGALLLGPLAWFSEPATFWPGTGRDWLLLIALSWGSQAAGQSLIAYGLRHLPAAFSSVTLLIQPVAAALFAWWLLAEPFGVWQAAGGALVLAGIVTCRLARQPAPVLK